LLLGRGMVSDDSEHACMTAQSLLAAPEDAAAFARSLAWRLRLWLLGLPAGMGWATLRAVFKLWLGFSPARSGVWSAGNGPSMRAAILGICMGHDADRLRAYVRASSRLTHTDPRAERGALLVALAAHYGAMHGPQGVRGDRFLRDVSDSLPDADEDLRRRLGKLEEHLGRGTPAVEFAQALGLHNGVSGYVYDTVPVALYCWLRHSEGFRPAVEEVIALGGDTDSTGAVVGGIAGATAGAGGIPAEWLDGLLEWPRSVTWMRRLAECLARQFPVGAAAARRRAPGTFWPALVFRNLVFLAVVLAHGLRRLLPPY
jgi:ADP-ribosylglycohydrolase